MTTIDDLRQRILSLQDEALSEPAPGAWFSPAAAGADCAVLHAAGLVDFFDDGHIESGPHRVLGLTAEGQRLSETIRDDSEWEQAKADLRAQGQHLTIDNVRNLLLVPRQTAAGAVTGAAASGRLP